jgi:hypothetical protein
MPGAEIGVYLKDTLKGTWITAKYHSGEQWS